MVERAVPLALCDELIAALPPVMPGRGGRRSLLHVPAVAMLARSDAIVSLIGGDMVAVRAILFDKSADANWNVSWHQDCVIKDGGIHIAPPADVLESMIAVRLHLDDCGADDGPLRVIPGSHVHGIVKESELARFTTGAIDLHARKGDVILMRPLLIHSSRPAAKPGHRRVLHIEFAAFGIIGA